MVKRILDKFKIRVYNAERYIIIVKGEYEYYFKKFWVG